MLMTPRRAAVRTRVLHACQRLLEEGTYPTGVALVELCPGHAPPLLIRIRDELIERREIDPTILWPAWTDDFVWAEGPDPKWRFRPARPPRHKRRVLAGKDEVRP